MPIEEWRNTDGWSLEENVDDMYAENPIVNMFDWKTYCFRIAKEETKKKAEEMLEKTLATNTWKMRYSKRGVVFFLTVKHWAQYVKNTLVHNNINWKDVPGYRIILKAILVEMKSKEV